MCLPRKTDLCKYQHEPESPQIDGERTRQVGGRGQEGPINYSKEQRFSLKRKKKAFFILVRT